MWRFDQDPVTSGPRACAGGKEAERIVAPAGLLWQLAAFLWFRFYDIVKPPPANYFDSLVKNGFGVMMDDVIAAGYTVLTLALFKAFLPF